MEYLKMYYDFLQMVHVDYTCEYGGYVWIGLALIFMYLTAYQCIAEDDFDYILPAMFLAAFLPLLLYFLLAFSLLTLPVWGVFVIMFGLAGITHILQDMARKSKQLNGSMK